MSPEMLRKEPTIAFRDDIPVLRDRVNIPWEKLEQALERVEERTAQVLQEAPDFAPMKEAERLRLAREEAMTTLIEKFAPALTASMQQQMDDMVNAAVTSAYHHLRSDLTRQLNALIVQTVREELTRVMREAEEKQFQR